MTRIAQQNVLDWCRGGGLHINQFNEISYTENSNVLRAEFPALIYRVPLVTIDLIRLLKEKSSSKFLTLWIRETGIWNDEADEVGVRLWNLFLKNAPGQSVGRDLGAALFDDSEDAECAGLSLLPMIYGWDAYLFPSNPDLYVYISHDEYIELGFRDAKIEPDLMNAVRCIEFASKSARSSL